ncbi:3-beta hydroxysteroid dehydrogenase/isomerase [Ustulina deusta]|nr:3-beta hydroxysteroid dehydrogenase/isomerase [Ustulina deusta]
MDALTGTQQVKWAAAVLFALGVAYLWRLNKVMSQTPPGAVHASPYRWADSEIKDTYKRIRAKPIDWTKHLPPKANRRYVVTGGSGGVGGQIILHLLLRGEPPESIRIVDLKKVERADMMTGAAAKVAFAQADITSPSATKAAFDKPWPKSVAKLPLTVFHTAALIIPGERTMGTFELIKRVNVDGTQNVMDAAKAAGATIFIATSSASVAHRPATYWGNPFRRWPKNYFQLIDESDFDEPLRPHSQFFGNYAHTKAIAERIVCQANSPNFRTGAIRPSNAIYGSSNGDVVVGEVLRSQGTQSWMGNIVQNFVHGGHISLGHLQFEAALLRKEMPKCAGRPFIITDDGPPPTYGDMYHLCHVAAETTVKLTFLPPAPFLILAHIVELVAIASRTPILKWIFPAPKGTIAILQPGVFHAGLNYVSTDKAAQQSVEQGGLGFRHVHTSMEGMCQQVLEWNNAHASPSA